MEQAINHNNPPPENLAAYVIMWTITVELDGPQMTIRRMRFPCRATKTTDTHTHTHTRCLSTTTMVARTRLSVTLYVQYSACLVFSKIVCSTVAVTNHFSLQQAQLMLSRYTVNTTPTTSPGQDIKNYGH